MTLKEKIEITDWCSQCEHYLVDCHGDPLNGGLRGAWCAEWRKAKCPKRPRPTD